MKKIISIFVGAVMLFGSIGTAFADNSVNSVNSVDFDTDKTLEGLTLSVKTRLEIPAEYTKLSTDRSMRGNVETVYFTWSTENEKQSISAHALTNGIITYYNDSKEERRIGISGYSKEEGARAANAFMARINPNIASQYIFNAEDVDFGYGVSAWAERYVNGIRVENDAASICLGSQSNQVIDFNLDYTEATFPSADNIISKDAAAEIFGEKADFRLAYKKNRENEAKLVYTDFNDDYYNKYVDALTGEWLTIEEQDIIFNKKLSDGGATKNGASADAEEMGLTEQEISEISKYDNFIKPEKGLEIIKGISEFGVSNYKLNYWNYYRDYDYEVTPLEASNGNANDGEENAVYKLRIDLQNKDDNSWASATLDAVTGVVERFYCGRYSYDERKNIINSNKAEEIADAFAKKMINGKNFEKVYKTDTAQDEVCVSYRETVDGVPFIDSGAEISIDLATGKVVGYDTFWQSGNSFAQKDELVSANMAFKVYVNACEFIPVYINESDSETPKYRLVYKRIYNPYAINAVSGTECDSDVAEYVEAKNGFSDISGHWAENIINTMAENHFLYSDGGEFRPDDMITATEASDMMCGANIYRSVFDDAETEKTLNREEAASAVVKGLGYGKVSEINSIFIPVFDDWNEISENARGSVAVAKGLGIINGESSGRFNPSKKITRAEFLAILYKVVKNGVFDY